MIRKKTFITPNTLIGTAISGLSQFIIKTQRSKSNVHITSGTNLRIIVIFLHSNIQQGDDEKILIHSYFKK